MNIDPAMLSVLEIVEKTVKLSEVVIAASKQLNERPLDRKGYRLANVLNIELIPVPFYFKATCVIFTVTKRKYVICSMGTNGSGFE